jgi:hypothetical protein
MKTTALAITGSLLINFALGLAIAALFSVASPALGAQRETPHACQGTHATRIEARSTRSAVTPAGHSNYVVAARMGWAIG